MIKINKLIRQKRKTIGLFVDLDGQLIVKAPLRTPVRELKRLVDLNTQWILDNQELMKTSKMEKRQQEFKDGEIYLFKGDEYPLKLVDWQDNPLIFNDGFYLQRSEVEDARFHFEQWYRRQAQLILGERVAILAGRFHFNFNQIRIKRLRSRWGSCSTKGNLNFNLWLILAPPNVIDYVIIHELCHMVERNHSPKFWEQVSKILPGYKRERAWLKENGSKMILW